MKEENLAWEEISTEHIIQDQWIDFRKSAYRFPNGEIWQPYYSFTRRNYAVVVASDEEGRFICVRQFRQGIRPAPLRNRTDRIRRTQPYRRRSGSFGRTPAMSRMTGRRC